MAFSISSVEYVKLISLNFMAKGSDQKSHLFGYSSFVSIFLTIERFILSSLDYLVSDYMNFVFFQFILGTITSFIGVCILLCLFLCSKRIIEKSEEIKRKNEELDKELERIKKEIDERAKEMFLREIMKSFMKEQEENNVSEEYDKIND